MISQRLRGLVNLHIVATAVAAVLVFGVCLLVLEPFFGVKFSADVDRLPYLLCVTAGMLLSGKYVILFGARFHRITWGDALHISTRQMVYVALLIFAFMFAAKERGASRIFLTTYLGLAWVVLLMMNRWLPHFLSGLLFQKQHQVPTLFVGNPEQIDRLRGWLRGKEALGIRPVGYITDGPPPTVVAGGELPYLGKVEDLGTVVDERMVMQVIVLDLPGVGGRDLVEACSSHGCRLLLYNNLADQLNHPLVPLIEEGHLFFSLQVEPLEDPINRMFKRAFDLAVALPVVLFVMPPLCAFVWLGQRKQAPGRLFFTQKRGGHNRKEIAVFKFRSMYDAANGAAKNEAQQARKGDDRIYPLGRFLRKSSLDEFPQFFNVLKGDMSVVGPRPHMLVHDEEFAKYFRGYRSRHFAKPGITGLAQIRGFRGEITDPVLLRQRVRSDLHYITNWSLGLDFQIVFLTAWHVVRPPKTAY